MGKLTFGRVAGAFFLLVAAVHAYRLFDPFTIQVGATVVPQYASAIGAVVSGAMGAWGMSTRC